MQRISFFCGLRLFSSGSRTQWPGRQTRRQESDCRGRESDFAGHFQCSSSTRPVSPAKLLAKGASKVARLNRCCRAVGDLICAGHQFRPHHAVGATQVVGNKFMARVGDELAENAKGQFRRQAVIKQRMRGYARKTQLNHRAGRKRGNTLEPRTGLTVMLVIFLEQRHEQVDIEQSGHGVRLSSS